MAVWCAIRTYAKHASELGNAVPSEPVFFLKADACVRQGGIIDSRAGEVHHEVELVYRIGENLHPDAMTVGLDLTLRSEQDRLKTERLPWASAKSFIGSAVIGEWVDVADAEVRLEVNGNLVQDSAGEDMVLSVEELISRLAEWAPIQPGDLLFTGTPSGVGPLNSGDTLIASLYNDSGILTHLECECL